MKLIIALLLALAAVQAFPSPGSADESGKSWKKAKASQFEQASKGESSSSSKKVVGDETIEQDVCEQDAASKSKKESDVSSGSKKTIDTGHGKITESVQESSQVTETKSSETKKKVIKTKKSKRKPDNSDECDDDFPRHSGFDDDTDSPKSKRRDSNFDDHDDFDRSNDDFPKRRRRKALDEDSGSYDGDDSSNPSTVNKKPWHSPKPNGSQTQTDTPDGKTQSQTIHSLSSPGNNFHGTLSQTQSMGKDGSRSQNQGAVTQEKYDKSADGKTQSMTRLDQEGKSDKNGQMQQQMLRNEEKTTDKNGYKDTKNLLAQKQVQTENGQSQSQTAMTETESYSETEC